MCNAKNPIRYIKISDLVYKDQFDPDMDEMDIYDDDDDSFRGPTYESDQL